MAQHIAQSLIGILESELPRSVNLPRRNSKVFNKMFSKAMKSLSILEPNLFSANQAFTLRNAFKSRPVRNSSSEDIQSQNRPRSSFLNIDSGQRNVFLDPKFGYLEKENRHKLRPKYISSNNLFKKANRSPTGQSLVDLGQRQNLVFPKLRLNQRPSPGFQDW